MDSKYVQQFKKGSYEMILLCLISQKETYGYEIISELNKRGDKFFRYAKEGTIYPILYRLQNAELIQCRIVKAKANGREKKFYSLTEKGKNTLKELTQFWSEYKVCVDNFINMIPDLEG